MVIRSVGSKILGKGGTPPSAVPPFLRARLVEPVYDYAHYSLCPISHASLKSIYRQH